MTLQSAQRLDARGLTCPMPGTWPAFNTVAALGMNGAVLVAVFWLHWPPEAMFGRYDLL